MWLSARLPSAVLVAVLGTAFVVSNDHPAFARGSNGADKVRRMRTSVPQVKPTKVWRPKAFFKGAFKGFLAGTAIGVVSGFFGGPVLAWMVGGAAVGGGVGLLRKWLRKRGEAKVAEEPEALTESDVYDDDGLEAAPKSAGGSTHPEDPAAALAAALKKQAAAEAEAQVKGKPTTPGDPGKGDPDNVPKATKQLVKLLSDAKGTNSDGYRFDPLGPPRVSDKDGSVRWRLMRDDDRLVRVTAVFEKEGAKRHTFEVRVEHGEKLEDHYVGKDPNEAMKVAYGRHPGPGAPKHPEAEEGPEASDHHVEAEAPGGHAAAAGPTPAEKAEQAGLRAQVDSFNKLVRDALVLKGQGPRGTRFQEIGRPLKGPDGALYWNLQRDDELIVKIKTTLREGGAKRPIYEVQVYDGKQPIGSPYRGSNRKDALAAALGHGETPAGGAGPASQASAGSGAPVPTGPASTAAAAQAAASTATQ